MEDDIKLFLRTRGTRVMDKLISKTGRFRQVII